LVRAGVNGEEGSAGLDELPILEVNSIERSADTRSHFHLGKRGETPGVLVPFRNRTAHRLTDCDDGRRRRGLLRCRLVAGG
jgi:hypothetical protein